MLKSFIHAAKQSVFLTGFRHSGAVQADRSSFAKEWKPYLRRPYGSFDKLYFVALVKGILCWVHIRRPLCCGSSYMVLSSEACFASERLGVANAICLRGLVQCAQWLLALWLVKGFCNEVSLLYESLHAGSAFSNVPLSRQSAYVRDWRRWWAPVFRR